MADTRTWVTLEAEEEAEKEQELMLKYEEKFGKEYLKLDPYQMLVVSGIICYNYKVMPEVLDMSPEEILNLPKENLL